MKLSPTASAPITSGTSSGADRIPEAPNSQDGQVNPPGLEVDIGERLTLHDWTVRIRVKQFAVGSSFAVLIFLGDVPANPDDWDKSSTFVDAHYTFVNSAANQCENCLSQQDIVTEGFVHLTAHIAKYASHLGSFEPNVVRPYLTNQLSWQVQRVRVFSALKSTALICFLHRWMAHRSTLKTFLRWRLRCQQRISPPVLSAIRQRHFRLQAGCSGTTMSRKVVWAGHLPFEYKLRFKVCLPSIDEVFA